VQSLSKEPSLDECCAVPALARQFRPGPEAVLLELAGCAIGAGVTPLAAIERELLEETVYTGGFHYLGCSLHCAHSTRLSHGFLATVCRKVAEPKLDAHEFIELVELHLDAFKEHVRGGHMTDTGDCVPNAGLPWSALGEPKMCQPLVGC
jgi:ADP-ribose pyrophosphatase